MKTMKHFVLAVALLTGALLALQGCDPQLTLSSDAGSDVTFKPSSGYPVTKTAYSGVAETVSGRKYERIDWVVGDVIRIYSPDVVQRSDFEAGNASDASLHWADYKVKSVTPRSEGSRYSDAKLDNASGNGLVWSANGQMENKFYAVYPAPGARETAGITDGSRGKFSCEIPAAQDLSEKGNMEYAFMVAKAAVAPQSDVNLEFSPAFTAFQFTFKSEAGSITLHSFTLSSESKALCGPFKIGISGTATDYELGQATGKDIVVDFGASGKVISTSQELTLTVLALPQTLYDDLSIKLTMSTAEETTPYTKTLQLKKNDAGVKFEGGLKHCITGVKVNGEAWSFKSIKLTGEAIEWTTPELPAVASETQPQSTQFAVSGVLNAYDDAVELGIEKNKKYRQYWVLGDNTATVTFKVFSPIGGTYEVVPEGDTDAFAISPATISGTINDPRSSSGVTKVSFTVKMSSTPASGSNPRLYFKTYVTGTDGTRYSLDSETQLFDTRGYHYFVYSAPTTY
ncbi:MAG: hypothetical protein IKH24_03310 [Bacteroidales bacterium]|nr:hypothetical protein [Bacteroidales bacterium]